MFGGRSSPLGSKASMYDSSRRNAHPTDDAPGVRCMCVHRDPNACPRESSLVGRKQAHGGLVHDPAVYGPSQRRLERGATGNIWSVVDPHAEELSARDFRRAQSFYIYLAHRETVMGDRPGTAGVFMAPVKNNRPSQSWLRALWQLLTQVRP